MDENYSPFLLYPHILKNNLFLDALAAGKLAFWLFAGGIAISWDDLTNVACLDLSIYISVVNGQQYPSLLLPSCCPSIDGVLVVHRLLFIDRMCGATVGTVSERISPPDNWSSMVHCHLTP